MLSCAMPDPFLSPLVAKILRLMLDPSTPDPEAIAAMAALRRLPEADRSRLITLIADADDPDHDDPDNDDLGPW